jgi:hypothetical protein
MAMNMAPGPDGARHTPAMEDLRDQIAEDRQALAETVAALQAKTDVKGRLHEKAVDAQLAAADMAGQVGRTAGSLPRIAKRAASTASDQVRDKVPEPVKTPIGQAAGLVRGQLRLVAAVLAASLAAIAMWRRWGR